MKCKRTAATLALVTVLVHGAFAQSGSSKIADTTSSDWTAEVLAEGLDYPWEIAHTGDRILVTEAAGDIVSIEDGAVRRHSIQTSDPIARRGGGGLLGMALSKDFESNGLAYFYHTYVADRELTNKVIEAKFDGNTWHETRVILEGIPGHRLYNGGRVALGPDGNLYVTTGWTENMKRPQDTSSLAGKVLRIAPDGSVPADNPFPGSYVYSLGHRNPQGIAWDDKGQLFVAEHGQSAHDEINMVKSGGNYGWPLIDGDDERAGMERSLIHSGNDTWAPSGIAFADNELLVAALVGKALYVFDDRQSRLKPIFSSGDRLRDVEPVADAIYVITTNRSPRAEGPSEDRLIRLTRHQ